MVLEVRLFSIKSWKKAILWARVITTGISEYWNFLKVPQSEVRAIKSGCPTLFSSWKDSVLGSPLLWPAAVEWPLSTETPPLQEACSDQHAAAAAERWGLVAGPEGPQGAPNHHSSTWTDYKNSLLSQHHLHLLGTCHDVSSHKP